MDQEERFQLILEALMLSSAAQGATTDALLTIILPLVDKDLITRDQANEFMTALRTQLEHVREINKLISELSGATEK
nr:hypothetical protein [uncultured Pseudomonas sp.]